MYENLFSRIIDSSKNNALTLFVGAGVSMLSNAPSWKGLIEDICSELGLALRNNYSFDDNLQIAQMLYYHFNKDEDSYYEFLKKRLSPNPLLPNDVHKELLKLNPHSIITTNFDELIEDAAIEHGQSFRTIACDSEVPSINGDRFILKVHGDLRHKNIVFKEEDYLNYSENFKLIETLLKSIFSTNTVVFIGYSLNDYNIKLVLNWAKSLLKDAFNKPIFIYTGSEILSREELIYQESKGLDIIEYYKVSGCLEAYSSRYLSILKSIQQASALSYDGKTPEEAFHITYTLLEPLDKLDSLRVIDVVSKLENNVHVNEDGTIYSDPQKCIAIKEFFRINSLPPEDFDKLSEADCNKFILIKRVLKKARIETVKGEFVPARFTEQTLPFADPFCILFDYQAMLDFTAQDYSSLKEKYLKAFYLAKLYKYEQSFFLFTDIAKEAFKKSDYLVYYLSEVNRSTLYRIIKNIDKYYHGLYDIEKADQDAPWSDSERLFDKLPVAFQNQYKSIKNLHSTNLLYQYSYDAFEDGQKLQKALESHTIEFGLTSAGKVICRINQYLHFLLGNHLLVDEFYEYKNTTRRMMDLLLHKYSAQEHLVLHEQLFPESQDKITFDEIDFYCFLEFFDAKELNRSLHKHQIETMLFSNTEVIEQIVRNIIDYYSNAQKKKSDNIDLLRIQNIISTCLVLLRHVDISQELVDYICGFLLKNDFREIMIDDKVLFLDSQVDKRHKVSPATKKIIEDKLIWYLDAKIEAEENGTSFEVFSKKSNINFGNLVHYISPNEKGYHSHRLSIRISRIIKRDISALFKQIVENYWAYLSTYQRYNVIKWAKNKLRENFNFDLLLLLLQCNARIDDGTIDLLKKHLNETIEKNASSLNSSNVTAVYPVKDPYEELNQVGYWCLIHALPRVFSEYLGISDRFDLYYLYKSFDFGKFNPAWLLQLNAHALQTVAKNKVVREKVRSKIADILNNQKLEETDKERLRTILTKYFC